MNKIFLSVLFLNIFAIALSYATPKKSLKEDLEEINSLIPTKKLTEIVDKYNQNDKVVKAVFDYIKSPEFLKVLQGFENTPEFKEVQKWFSIQMLNERIGEFYEDDEHYEVFYNLKAQVLEIGGWKAFMKEFRGAVPREEIKKLVAKKIAEAGVFAEFMARLKTLEPVYDKYIKTNEAIKVIKHLADLSVDVKELNEIIKEYFEWM